MQRRVFLKRGLLGGVLLVAGGATLGLSSTKVLHKPKRGLKVLDDREFAIMGAIAVRVAPPGADAVEITHAIDELLAISIVEARSDVKALLKLFDNALAGFVFDLRYRPFTALSPEQQDAALAAWRGSRITIRRGGYLALRKLVMANHYSSTAVWEGVGYPGPPEIATEAT